MSKSTKVTAGEMSRGRQCKTDACESVVFSYAEVRQHIQCLEKYFKVLEIRASELRKDPGLDDTYLKCTQERAFIGGLLVELRVLEEQLRAAQQYVLESHDIQ